MGVVIDDDEHESGMQNYKDGAYSFKSKLIPKGVLTLEKLFDLQTRFRTIVNMKTNNSCMSH
jgi:hypothetical protein